METAAAEPTPEMLAAGLPDLRPLIDRRAVELWLGRQGMSLAELRHSGRDALHLEARRHVCIFLRRRGWSFPMIGVLIERDHTTVMNLVAGRAR